MNITDTKIRKIFKEGALRAIVSVTLDEWPRDPRYQGDSG